MTRPLRGKGPVLLLLVVLFPLPGPGGAAEPPRESLVGRSLAEALLLLQERGLDLVFTSQVVGPKMRVETEPTGKDLRALLRSLLEPHGLNAREGIGGLLVIVPESPSSREEAERTDPEAGDRERRPRIEDEIVVRPSEVSVLTETPEGPFAFDRQELERVPHLGGDAFRAMPLVPGTATNDLTARFSVRGSRPDEVLIRLDGQELYEPYHLKDYDAALSIVPTGALASATLTTGGFPASRGDRMGGVLDLRTAQAAGPERFRLGLGILNASAGGSGELPGGRGGWSLTLRRGSADLAEDFVGDENPRFWDAFGRLDLRPGRSHRLTARSLAAEDEFEFRELVDGEEKRYETDYDNRYGWITHQGLPGSRMLLQTKASWSGLRRDRRGEELEEEGSFAIRDRRRTEVLGLAQTADLQAGLHNVFQIGWEARRFDVELRYDNRVDRDLEIFAPFSPPRERLFRLRRDLRDDHLGAWLTDRLRPGDGWTLEAGLRFDRHTATDDTLWSPRFNLARRLGDRSLVRASWGRFHQSQRPYELLVEDGQSELQSAERADHWVLGYERRLDGNSGSGAVRIELFRREIEDPRVRFENLLEPINVFPEIEPDRIRIAPDRSTAEGVELLLRGPLGSRSRGWLAYTWSESRDVVEGREVPRALDQTHSLVVNLSHNLTSHWTLDLVWNFHTGWPTTPVTTRMLGKGGEGEGSEEPEIGLAFGNLRSQRLPDYHRLDLRVSRTWVLQDSSILFYADVQNAYDRSNVGGFDPGLDEEGGVVLLESEPWPGVLPSLGVVWEF